MEKIRKSGGEEEIMILEFREHGVEHFGISEGKVSGGGGRGIKMFIPLVVG